MTTTPLSPRDPAVLDAVHALLTTVGGDPSSFDGRLVSELMLSALKLVPGQHDTGQLKLMNAAMKEMRYAYSVFNRYIGHRKISIFGSARTPEDHADYIAAREFSRQMAHESWMSITGAGDGIMKAGHEGPERERSFGLSIRLPFETTANEVIEGDPKLINFRYFFTRKLMFLSHADAVAAFPGGYGTQDELFEALVLVQTGKSNIVPIVLLEGTGGVYWEHWRNYIEKSLLEYGWISPEDESLFYIASSPEDGVRHVLDFYRMYHSSRYVGPDLVIRMHHPISGDQLAQLNEEFSVLVESGEIRRTEAMQGETEHLQLPRIAFHHTRHKFGVVRQLIDRLNTFAPEGATSDGLNAP